MDQRYNRGDDPSMFSNRTMHQPGGQHQSMANQAMVNNFMDDGQNYQCTESSEEYIDDYYAASAGTNMHHQRFVPRNTGQLEVIREQTVSITSAQPSTISSSDANMNNASVNIAVLGHASQDSSSKEDESRQVLRDGGGLSQDTRHLQEYDFSFDRNENIFSLGEERYRTTPLGNAADEEIGSGLLSPQRGAAAVPLGSPKENQMNIQHTTQSASQPLMVLGSAEPLSQKIIVDPSVQVSNPAQQQPSKPPKNPRRKRKMNDDYGIYYNYTCESDSSQTTPRQQQNQTASSVVNNVQAPQLQQARPPAIMTSPQSKPASTGPLPTATLQRTQLLTMQLPEENEQRLLRVNNKELLQEHHIIGLQSRWASLEDGVTSESSSLHNTDQFLSEKPKQSKNNDFLTQAQSHGLGLNENHPHGRNLKRFTPHKMLAANSIMPPAASISSAQKRYEEKSFRHDFYSMDQAEANEQLGANPISLGNENDYGQTMTQTGLEALMEDDLILEMVMSRVDWIIVLRDLFYSMLDGTQPRQTGRVRADRIFRQLVQMQETLKLLPKDEYALSTQRHEVCVTYGTILQNLKNRIIDLQRDLISMQTQKMTGKTNLSLNSADFGQGIQLVTLQLDEVIDLPFKRGDQPEGDPGFSKTANQRIETEHEVLNEFNQAKILNIKKQALLQHKTPNVPRETLQSLQLSDQHKQVKQEQDQAVKASEPNQQKQSFEYNFPSKRTSTPQIHTIHERQKTSIGVAKLSSIDSRPSSSEPDIQVTSMDESRQQVYGSKQRRSSGTGARSSSKRRNSCGRKQTKSTSPKRRITSALQVTPEDSNTQLRVQASVSIGNFYKNHEHAKKGSKKAKRRMSQIAPERPPHAKPAQQTDEMTKTVVTLLSSVDNIFGKSETPADSQVQLLSIDAFKYTTQSPPLTMVTKTLLNNHNQYPKAHKSVPLSTGSNDCTDEIAENDRTKLQIGKRNASQSRRVKMPTPDMSQSESKSKHRLQALQLLTPEKAKSQIGDSVTTTQKKTSYKYAQRRESMQTVEQIRRSAMLIPTFSQKRLHPSQLVKNALISPPKKVEVLEQETHSQRNKAKTINFTKFGNILTNTDGQVQKQNVVAGFFEQSPFSNDQFQQQRDSKATSHKEPVLEFPAPISQFQEQQLRHISEIGESGRAKPEELMTTERLLSNDDSRTSVLLFDHGNMISSPCRTRGRMSTVRDIERNKNSPKQTWRHLFAETSACGHEPSDQVTCIERRPSTIKVVKQHGASVIKSFGGIKSPLGHVRSKVVSLERLTGDCLLQDESAHRKEFYDVDYFGKDLRETQPLNDLEMRKGIKSHLRSMNLGQNLLFNFYELGQTEARQLLILNLSLNQIVSLSEVAQCSNLQFLNLAFNCISDASEVNKLRQLTNLQELYLSHNKVNFQFSKDLDQVGGGPSRRNYRQIWPVLEVLDLTANRCTDWSQISYLFTGQFVSPSVIRIVAVMGNFTAQTRDTPSQEKCQQQIDFNLSYFDILHFHSKLVQSKDEGLIKACIGVQSPTHLREEVTKHMFKLERVSEEEMRLTLAHQSTEKAQIKKTPAPLQRLQRGQVAAHGVASEQECKGGTDDKAIEREQACETVPRSKGKRPRYMIADFEPTKQSQSNLTKMPGSSSSQVQSKKKLLRILSPNAQDTASAKQTTSKGQQSTVKEMGSTAPQDKRVRTLKLLKPSKKQATLAQTVSLGMSSGKPGVKQIQMVYLNPSQAGSRRSPSIRSNRSGSRQSRSDHSQPAKGSKGLRQAHGLDSINEAYQREGKTFKQQRIAKEEQVVRNKSISSRETKKKKQVLSPTKMKTPRFDSYEALPKQRDQLVAKTYNSSTKQPSSAQTAKPVSVHSKALQKSSFTVQKQGGVSTGLCAMSPNALKLSVPPNTSPLKRNKAKVTLSQQNVLRVKLKTTTNANNEGGGIASHRRELVTQADSFLQPMTSSDSAESRPPLAGASGIIPDRVKSVKQPKHAQHRRQSNQASVQPSVGMSRVQSQDGSFVMVGGTGTHSQHGIYKPMSGEYDLPETQNVYHLQLANLLNPMPNYSKTVIQQRAGALSMNSAKLSVSKKTPKRLQPSTTADTHPNSTKRSRDKSSSIKKLNTASFASSSAAYSVSQSQLKHVTLSQNSSALLQRLQQKNKQGQSQNLKMAANQTRKQLVASLSKEKKKRGVASPSSTTAGAGVDKPSGIFELKPVPLDGVSAGFPASAQNATMANKNFRLFTTQQDINVNVADVDETQPVVMLGDGGHSYELDEDDKQQFEAMVARENLPNEPLMPRSHNSSARSFLKNMSQLNGTTSSKSFPARMQQPGSTNRDLQRNSKQ